MKTPRKPSEKMALRALEVASNVCVDEWRLVRVSLNDLRPTQQEPEPPRELVRLMRKSPGKVPPIVVFYASAGNFEIIDGHHRWMAAKDAGLKSWWAVEILQGAYC